MAEPAPPSLSPDEIQRYARHIVLPELGGPGQQKLKAARVLVIGAGGLGAPVIAYLAAAGVGTIGIVDDDIVSLSNLQRQVIHRTESIGIAKTESAAQSVRALNDNVEIVQHQTRLDRENAQSLLAGYNLIIDGSDNFDTRYLAADTALGVKIPLVTGAVGRFDGSLTVILPDGVDAEGRPHPSFRDLFPEPPPAGLVPSCAEAGVVGALTGVIGTLQAMEAIKLITGIGEPLVGRLLLYDALGARFDVMRYRKAKEA